MIDIGSPVYFYNKNGVLDQIYKLKTILYTDDEICLCVAYPYDSRNHKQEIGQDIKFSFFIEDGFVDSSFHHSLRATNELELAESFLFEI